MVHEWAHGLVSTLERAAEAGTLTSSLVAMAPLGLSSSYMRIPCSLCMSSPDVKEACDHLQLVEMYGSE